MKTFISVIKSCRKLSFNLVIARYGVRQGVVRWVAAEEEEEDMAATRSFRCVHQFVSISHIDLADQSLQAFTELSLTAINTSAKGIRLNVNIQVVVETVTVNDADVPFIHHARWTEDVVTGESVTALKPHLYKAALSVDPDVGNGELHVDLSGHIALVKEQKVFKLGIDYHIAKPSSGIVFVANSKPSTSKCQPSITNDSMHRLDNAHCFTYRSSSLIGHTRHWLPCIDATGELCLWRIEISVPPHLTVVCSGELMDVTCASNDPYVTYYHQVDVPTSPSAIGFAIAQLECLPINKTAHTVSTFCPPGLKNLLVDTVSQLSTMNEFYESLLNTRYPYSSYKVVFVEQSPVRFSSYAGLTICRSDVLFKSSNIDAQQECVQVLSHALAEQWFGTFVVPRAFTHSWITVALARYMMGLYIAHTFGDNEYKFMLFNAMESVVKYQQLNGPIFLCSDDLDEMQSLYFDCRTEDTCPSSYLDMLARKAHLVMRVLEHKLGYTHLLHVLHRVLAKALSACKNHPRLPSAWSSSLVLCTDSLLAAVNQVTAVELPLVFVRHAFYNGTHYYMDVSYVYNRRRHSVDVEIVQATDAPKFVGALTVNVQEVDGNHSHVVQVEGETTHQELPCHSKGRRHKKRSIALSNGKEVDMDLAAMEGESPVLWLTVDEQMTCIRQINLTTDEYTWHYMLRHECNVVSQLNAITTLSNNYVNEKTNKSLISCLEQSKNYYRVRCHAALQLSVATKAASHDDVHPLLKYYRQHYCTRHAVSIDHDSLPPSAHLPKCIVETYDGEAVSNYFVLLSCIRGLSRIRTKLDGLCPLNVQQQLLVAHIYNDNRQSPIDDDTYKSILLTSLSNTLAGNHKSVITQDIVDEMLRSLNVSQVCPSFNNVTMCASLISMTTAMRLQHLPLTTALLWPFATSSNSSRVRLAALNSLLTFSALREEYEDASTSSLIVKGVTRECTVFERCLQLAVRDSNAYIRYELLKLLKSRVPFTHKATEEHAANTAEFSATVWKMVIDAEDSAQRGLLLDIHQQLYGLGGRAKVDEPAEEGEI